MLEYIEATDLKNMILCADTALEENIQEINELNVFPVPDGDTGTNMSLTMNNAAEALRKKEVWDSVAEVSSVTASGLLRGARGNSGVITSLLFRGVSKKLKGLTRADARQYAAAMNEGVETAYKAVMKPAEGTILTVSRKAAEAAVNYAKRDGSDILQMLQLALDSAREALVLTTEQNPVLKKAGVVDAGGKGYVVCLEAMLACLRGEFVPKEKNSASSADANVFQKFSTEEITYAYDTVYIIRRDGNRKPLDLLRAYLDSIGDSLVIGEDDDMFKVHVHTNTPGQALTESQKYGTLEVAKIENMRTQHDEVAAGGASLHADDVLQEDEPEDTKAEKEYGAVAVCVGDGIVELFHEIGVDQVVSGGQSMNPSTEDILRAVEKTPARTVFIFPNNKNIFMAAEQCRSLTDKNLVLIRSRNVPQGISAMLCFEPDQKIDVMTEAMNAAMENVHTVMITYAARDSDYDGYEIHQGEYLSLYDGALAGSSSDIDEIVKMSAEAAREREPEIITIYYGEDTDEQSAQKLCHSFENWFPDAEVSAVYGGQPLYYYMISIE